MLSLLHVMRIDTQPAIARRMRMSTAGITAAVTVTCLALLAIAVAVGPQGDANSAVTFESPEANNGAARIAPAVFTGSTFQPVADSATGSVSSTVRQ